MKKCRESFCPWSHGALPAVNPERRSALSLDLTVQMTRYTVYHDRRYIALDQRAYIVYKFVCHISSVLIDPLARNKFFIVCNLMDILYFSSALIRIIGNPVQYDHLSGVAFISCFYSRASDLGSLQDIDTGCTV